MRSPSWRAAHWMYDQDGKVLEYGESQALADRWASYDYDVSR